MNSAGDARAEAITQRWSEIEPLLDALLELPPEQRGAALERACNDAALRALVGRLLALDGADSDVDRLARALGCAGAGIEGQQIGPYRIERALGEGGMGAVFLAARRTTEFTQHVALKLLRVGLFSALQQEQFRREQQIHARLEHPHIARVYDSGITSSGVPYFAMEYVDGVAVTDYCDRERLGIDARLRLFAAVCDAVAYAHQNLIVHRDLKPSNILVDRSGAPKLLDFGIAKLLPGAEGSGERTHTELRRLTPDYAAPEQFSGGPITTATDVHALGVLLCELLSAARPVRSDDETSPLRAISRRLRADAAAARGLGPAALRRRLAGDLEAIVAKALQREPARRYAGAAALRDDIGRHLAGQPLQARPDAWTYRAGKFVQRHSVGIAASAALAATLVGATAISLRQTLVAREQAQRANAEAARANAVKTFLQGLFDSAAPGTSTVESADELLARGRERIDSDFAANPDLHVETLGLLGDLVRRRGHDDAALEMLERAADLAAKQFGAADERTLAAEFRLAEQADDAGRYRDGAARLQKALDAFAHPAESEVRVQATSQLGVLYSRAGENERGIGLARDAVAMARRVLPADHATAIWALTNLGNVYKETGRFDDALPLLEEALANTRRALGEQHAEVAEALAAVASVKQKLGRYAESEQLSRQAVAIDAKVYPHPNLYASVHLANLGVTLDFEYKFDEALETYARALAMDRVLYPQGHTTIAIDLGNMAMARYRMGRYAEAEAGMREAIAEQQRLLGAQYPDYGFDQNSLATILIDTGQLDEAQRLLDSALADSIRAHGAASYYEVSVLTSQARLAGARGDHAAAAELARAAVASGAKARPPGHYLTIQAQQVLGEILYALGRHAEARAVLAEALASARNANPPVAVVVAHTLADTALVEDALGRADAAAQARAQARSELAKIPPGPIAERDQVERLLEQAPRRQAEARVTR